MRNAAGTADVEEARSGRDPDQLEAEAEQVREQEQRIAAEVDAHRAALEQAVTARRTAEDAAAEEERRIAGLQRAAADRREGLARLHGQVNALKSRAAAADDEVGRLGLAREEAVARADRAQRDFTSLETRVAGLDAGEEGLDAEHEGAVGALDDIEERLAKARDEATQADRDRSSLAARKDALEMGLNRKDGAGALLAASDSVSGLLGSVAALLAVRSRLRDRGRRRPRLGRRRRRGDRRRRGGRAPSATSRATTSAAPACCSGGGPAGDRDWPGLPVHATYAVDVVECPDDAASRPSSGCCPRSPSSTTSTPPVPWSPTSPTSPP